MSLTSTADLNKHSNFVSSERSGVWIVFMYVLGTLLTRELTQWHCHNSDTPNGIVITLIQTANVVCLQTGVGQGES